MTPHGALLLGRLRRSRNLVTFVTHFLWCAFVWLSFLHGVTIDLVHILWYAFLGIVTVLSLQSATDSSQPRQPNFPHTAALLRRMLAYKVYGHGYACPRSLGASLPSSSPKCILPLKQSHFS